MGHVHGLGTDPGDGTLYVASHAGVFRVDGKTPERVADRWQDTMAFTVVGPGHFLASGHPDLREDLPVHLGLIESRDAAESWSSLSLAGEADFHALDVSGNRTFAYDSLSSRLMTTTDRVRWRTMGTGEVVDLAADPSDSTRVLVTDPAGKVSMLHVGKSKPTPLQAPPLVLVDSPEPSLLVGVGPAGAVFQSTDGGQTWVSKAHLEAAPEALDVAEGRWHVATDGGIYRSDDDGRTWRRVIATDPGGGH